MKTRLRNKNGNNVSLFEWICCRIKEIVFLIDFDDFIHYSFLNMVTWRNYHGNEAMAIKSWKRPSIWTKGQKHANNMLLDVLIHFDIIFDIKLWHGNMAMLAWKWGFWGSVNLLNLVGFPRDGTKRLRLCPWEDQAGVTQAIFPICMKLGQIEKPTQ